MARTVAAIQADLDSAYAARTKIIAGERVTQIERDGRSMQVERLSLEGVNAVIADLERELASATASESGRPRRRPISLVYGN